MRKLFSIALIVLLLLNVMGFYGVFVGMQYQNDVAMNRVLDANSYDESQTVTIKVPISVPYMSDYKGFERVTGTFEHEGQTYRLVKQMYAQDTLTVICVKDVEHQRIDQALSKYVESFSDQNADQDQNSKITISFIKEYLPQAISLKSISSGWEMDVVSNSHHTHLVASFFADIVHPPERA